MRGTHTVREYKPIDIKNKEELNELISLKTPKGDDVFVQKSDGTLRATNYVGVVTTKRGTIVEILPKIPLGPDDKTTKHHLIKMLRCSRYLQCPEELPKGESDIRAVRRFPMLEVFVRRFLDNLNTLARGGLARRYIPVEENLPYLRGRLLFREQVRENLTNQARFYVAHDELSVNRPANRLIHTALTRLTPFVRDPQNRRLLGEMRQVMEVAEVPQAANTHADWHQHQVDRSMPHYKPVMQWVGLFLLGKGLTTFAGRHRNLSLLFPMEEVFEDFVTHSFGRYLTGYDVVKQGPPKYLAKIDGENAFLMKPDISLREKGRRKDVRFILDAKWKHIDTSTRNREDVENRKHGIDQDDLYQLYAYGKGYQCEAVALVYPRSRTFMKDDRLEYRILGDLTLFCLPFDVKDPEGSVKRSMCVLKGGTSAALPSF